MNRVEERDHLERCLPRVTRQRLLLPVVSGDRQSRQRLPRYTGARLLSVASEGTGHQGSVRVQWKLVGTIGDQPVYNQGDRSQYVERALLPAHVYAVLPEFLTRCSH